MRFAFLIVAALLAASSASSQDTTSETMFLTNARRLTLSGARAGEGYFSPDGTKMIFQSEREPGNPFFQIYIMEFATGKSWRVSPGVGKTTCSFFRPGTDEVEFSSTHLDPESKKLQDAENEFRAMGKERRYSWDYDEHYDIFSAKQDGTNLKQLTTARGYDAEGDYSPDGSKIVFCSMRLAYDHELSADEKKHFDIDPSFFGEIYIMNADGSNQTRLTNAPGYDGGPFFSPDGKRILWRRFDPVDIVKADVWTMNPDGTDQHKITHFDAMSWAPYYHPSMKYIIFASNKLGFTNFELYLTDLDGAKEPVRVTFTDGFDGLPVFSPDGTKLSWTSNRKNSGKGQIWIADWNHEAALKAIEAARPAVMPPPQK